MGCMPKNECNSWTWDKSYLNQRVWGALADVTTRKKYDVYAGSTGEFKPLRKYFLEQEIEAFIKKIYKEFKVQVIITEKMKMNHVIRVINKLR